MKIKSLTVKLAALLCACGLAFSAQAANVAQIGDMEYESLAAAVAAAQDGATKTTITLLADIALDNTVEIEWPKPASGSGLFIDLNNHNITATDCRALWIKTGYVTLTGHGTISSVATENSSFSKDSSVIRVGSTESQAQAAATLDMKAEVTVSTTHCYGITVFGNNKGTNGQTLKCLGTVTTKDRPAIAGNGTSTLSSTSITIDNGATVSATSEYAIYHPQAGALSIKGTVTGLGGIEMKAGTLTIDSTGIITATGTASHPGVNNNGASTSGYALVLVENSGYKGVATAKISKGAINGTIGIIADDDVDSSKKATLAVSGGSFSLAVPNAYCADGYEPTSADSNDRYTVQVAAASAVAKITRDNVITYYLTVLDAVNAAQNGETVTMIADFSKSYPAGGLINVAAGKSVTLDLNNHSIINLSATRGYVASLTNGSSTLTLKGTGSIQGNNAINVTGRGAKVIIDGNITVTGTEACFRISGNSAANPEVEIKNGTFHGGSLGVFYKVSLPNNITIAISGGLYSTEVPAAYCADDYKPADGTVEYDGKNYYTVTLKGVAKIGDTYYDTFAAALLAAKDGDTIEILDGTWGAEAVGTLTTSEALSIRAKSLTIQPAAEATVTFTANVTLGYDDSSTRNAAITVKGLAFDGASMLIGNYAQTTVENCSFTGGALRIIESCASNYNREDFIEDQVTIKNCSFDGTAAGEPALRVRNSGNLLIEGNKIANSNHNGILLESNGTVNTQVAKTVVIRNNTITEWNAGDVKDGGRGIRASLGTMAAGSTVTITGNVLRKVTTGLDTPDFMKITDAGSATVDLSGNDWNDMLLSEVKGNSAIYTCNVTATLDSVITTKVPVARIGTTEYLSLADAVAAAQAGDTITILQDVADAGNITLKAGVMLDGNGKTISGNSAVYVNVAGGTIQNVTFQNIHNAANNLSAVYARSLEGELVITECTFDRCDWDAIQVTPVTGAEITITENTFRDDTTDGIKQQRFVHIQSSAKSEQFFATVTDNVMLGETAQEALEVYYPASPDYVQLAGNYIEYSHKVCILTGDGTNANELAWPQRSQADINDDDKMVVATIPSTYTSQFFTNLADAVAVAQAGDTIKLLADADLEETVVITKSLTVDLNGNNISATDCRALWIKSGEVALVTPDDVYGAVSATDDLGVEANPVFKSNSSVIRVGDSVANTKPAKLTIGENVHIETGYCYGVTVFGMNDDGNEGADIQLVVKNGATVCADGDQPAISGNGTNSLKPTAITIEEGASVEASYDYAIYHPGKGTLTINGSVEGLGGIEVKSGTVIIGEGAVITATSEDEPSHTLNNNGTSTVGYAIAAVGNPAYVGDPAVKISGGTITGTIIALSDTGSEEVGATIAVSGGRFNSPVLEDFCAVSCTPCELGEGWYSVTIQGTYEVEVSKPVSQEVAQEIAEAASTEAIKLPAEVAAELKTVEEVADYKKAFKYEVTEVKEQEVTTGYTVTPVLNPEATVTLTGDTEATPVKAVSTGADMEGEAKIEIKTIPGLYYSVSVSDTVDGDYTPVDESADATMATAKTMKLDVDDIVPEEAGSTKYIKVTTTATSSQTGSQVKSTTTVGVMKTDTPKKLEIVPVPWKGMGEETATVKVSDIIKTSTLDAGTKIYVGQGASYKVWQLGSDGKWQDLNAAVATQPGQEAEPQEGVDASTISVPQGDAFWVEQEDPKPIVMIGEVGETPTKKEVSANTSGLCASPKGEEFDLSTITTAGTSDTITVLDDNGKPTNLYYRNGGWKVKRYDVQTRRNVWVDPDEDLLKIKAGAGFWYNNHSGNAKSINW